MVVPCVLTEAGEHMFGGQSILDDAWLPNVVNWPMRVTEKDTGSEYCLGEDALLGVTARYLDHHGERPRSNVVDDDAGVVG